MLRRPAVRTLFLAVLLLTVAPAAAWPTWPTWDNDPQEALQYGVAQNGTAKVWRDYGAIGDPAITIAVLDTGIDATHPDLAANLWKNAPEATGTAGVDDDRNGLVDDVIGYDFVNGRAQPIDEDGHGTHVTGIAAAVGGNGLGIAGQCPRCSIMTLKIRAGQKEPLEAAAVAGVEYAVKKNAAVILIPWATSVDSPKLRDALKAASDAGRIIVSAAGNEGADLNFAPFYPAKYKLAGQIAVAGLYHSPAGLPFWTNFGAPFVQLSSGGAEVYSTWPGGTYVLINGTGMAAAQVAGGAALIKSHRPGLKSTQIIELMKNTIRDDDSASSTAFGGRPDMVKIFSKLR